MENRVDVRATFTGCNIKSGKVVMQFELDPEYRGALPVLAMMTGTPCLLTVSSDQKVLFVDRGTGEFVGEQDDGQTAIEYEEAEPDEVPDAPMLPAAEFDDPEDGDDWDEFDGEAA